MDTSTLRGTPVPCTTPTNVKFGADVLPIFQTAPPAGAGCATSTMCHKKQGSNLPASGFVLGGNGPNTDAASVYANIQKPANPAYANTTTPANSQLLLRPTQALTHPQQILQSPDLGVCDPFYLTIYGWIAGGAPNN